MLRTSRGGYSDYLLSDSLPYFYTLSNLDTSSILEDINVSFFIPYQKRPDDPFYLEPLDLYDTLIYRITEAERAWEYTTGDPNIKIANLDSGVDYDHYDLNVGNDGYTNIDFANSWNYIDGIQNVDEDFNSDCHGTKTTGIIGAKMNNTLGVASIAGGWTDQGVSIIIHVVGRDVVDYSVVDNAIEDAADKGVRIISCAFAIENPPEDDIDNVEDAIDYAVEKGVMVFASSGNRDVDVMWPANYEPVIAVGATDPEVNGLEIKEYRWDAAGPAGSAYGEKLDISAPVRVVTTRAVNYNNTNQYDFIIGTSTSCPYTAGIAGLMLSLNPCLTSEQVEQLLYSTADKVGNYEYNHDPERPGHSKELGYGRVNACEALNAVDNLFVPDYEIDDSQTWSNDLLQL